MSETQHTVSVLPSSVTAEVVRSQLEAAGINTTTVEDDGSFRLLVDEADFERAMKLLFPAPESVEIPMPGADTGQLWFCAHCGEEIQPQSDVCWACGKPRAGVKPQPKASSAVSSPPAPAPRQRRLPPHRPQPPSPRKKRPGRRLAVRNVPHGEAPPRRNPTPRRARSPIRWCSPARRWPSLSSLSWRI